MEPIKKFVEHKSPQTQKTYTWILQEYHYELDANPETYFDNGRDYQQDVKNWWRNRINEVPKTRLTKMSAVKNYLEEYGLEFSNRFWKKLRDMKKGHRAVTLDRTPKYDEFKRILQLGTVKDRALFLFAVSSGARIGEILKLEMDDIDLNHNPPKVTIPANITKTGDSRITFITPEAKEHLLLWLKERDRWLEIAYKNPNKRNELKSGKKDNRIFPFSYNLAWTRWLTLIKKAGLKQKDKVTGHYTLHIHVLRKFFLSQLKLDIPYSIAEALSGHEEYLDEAYRKYTHEQLAEFYKQGMSRLTILQGEHPDLTEHNQRITQLEKENIELKEQLDKLIRKLAIDNWTK